MTAADEYFKSAYAQTDVAAREKGLSGAAYESLLAKLMEPGSVACCG